jgi:atypical dual specificity phosphatase
MKPSGFSWIERPELAGMGLPESPEELAWLRSEGISLLMSLTEDPLPRPWINDAGLLYLHVPVEDMHPPSQSQIDLAVSAIAKARDQGIGVGVHCTAGYGRTGTILACAMVKRGMASDAAIAKIRDLRPGSIETDEQEDAVREFGRRLRA